MAKKFNFIYKITNTINHKIYIGQHTTDKLEDGYFGSGVLIKKAIKKYGVKSFKKEFLAFTDNEDNLDFLEKYYIKKYKSNVLGYNLTNGGERNFSVSEESREKNRLSHLGKTTALRGRSLSPEHKDKISRSNKGHKNWLGKFHTKKSKKDMSYSHRPDYAKNCKIFQYNKSGQLINIFDSVTDAGVSEGILRTSISNCLNNKSKTAGGFLWKYEK